MTIAENIETTRMSLSPQKTPGNGEKRQSRLKSRTSDPPRSQEKTVKFKARKEKPKISKGRHDSVEEDDEEHDDDDEMKEKKEEKPSLQFKNFLNDKK